jgi:TusA-related sulfurtransferase
MTSATGHFRNGVIELDGPPPEEWVDGAEVSVSMDVPTNGEIDITGDCPEAITAWLKWYDQLHIETKDSSFHEELEHILKENKEQELVRWEEYTSKIERMFQ